jgi:hypothetical protein
MNSEFSDFHEELAQQLRDDAQRLARLYPPASAHNLAQRIHERIWEECPSPILRVVGDDAKPARSSPRKTSTPLKWSYVAAATVLLFTLTSAFLWQQPDRSQVPDTAKPSATFAADSHKDSSSKELIPPQQFQTLSAPQQEAFLDLLEAQNMPLASLSI